MTLRPQGRLSVLLLTICLVLSSAITVRPADFISLIRQSREQSQNDQFVEALASAQDAVRANAKDYKGYYYVAVAYLGMGSFNEAETAAASSLQLAPASFKPGVERLVDAIKTRRQLASPP